MKTKFICDLCDLRFPNREEWQEHIDMKHREEYTPEQQAGRTQGM